MAYFLVAVSTRENLDLCREHALAGFPGGRNGLWTYLDIDVGDLVSFLYGARAFDLYRVVRKAAYRQADKLPPWPPLELRQTYYFPFRLHLEPIRTLVEPMVRPEFAYVAENLLLRGGYRKTHFQADQTTLQWVSEMGSLRTEGATALDHSDYEEFAPTLTRVKEHVSSPTTIMFNEMFLQAMIRKHLSDEGKLAEFTAFATSENLPAKQLEVLGEKAFPQGLVDLLIKEATPKGTSRKILIEVKNRASSASDLRQISAYRDHLGSECIGAVLVARSHSQAIRARAAQLQIRLAVFETDFTNSPATFDDLLSRFRLIHLNASLG